MVRNAIRRRPTISRLRIGHFTSRYPIVSHAFIAREVRELRELGADVHTFTLVRPTDEFDALSPADREEAETTTAIRPVSPVRLIRDHAVALARSPRSYVAAFGRAFATRRPGPRGALWALFYFVQAIRFSELCRERDLRHVHVHHANVAADLAMIATRYGFPKTWSITIHGPAEFDDPDFFQPGAKASDAALVVTISEFAREQVLALAPDARVAVVRLGVELERLRYRHPRPHRDPLQVLNVAQLAKRKGHADLLHAFAELGDHCRLTIIGGGEELEELEALARELGIAERVNFRGPLGQEQTLAAYADADIFCLPSYAEGLPVVLMEAMASGVPVVATDVAAVGELVRDDETGLLIHPGRPQEVADAIRRLGADAELRERLAGLARATVEAEYNLKRNARKLYKLLAEL